MFTAQPDTLSPPACGCLCCCQASGAGPTHVPHCCMCGGLLSASGCILFTEHCAHSDPFCVHGCAVDSLAHLSALSDRQNLGMRASCLLPSAENIHLGCCLQMVCSTGTTVHVHAALMQHLGDDWHTVSWCVHCRSCSCLASYHLRNNLE